MALGKEKRKWKCDRCDMSGHYALPRDQQIVGIHPSTGLQHKPEWIVYHEFVLTSKNFMRTCTQVHRKPSSRSPKAGHPKVGQSDFRSGLQSPAFGKPFFCICDTCHFCCLWGLMSKALMLVDKMQTFHSHRFRQDPS